MLLEDLKSVETHTPEEIVAKWNKDGVTTSIKEINAQIKLGMEIEKEHSTAKGDKREITLDHLWKDGPTYYTFLGKMEKEEEDSNKKKQEKSKAKTEK